MIVCEKLWIKQNEILLRKLITPHNPSSSSSSLCELGELSPYSSRYYISAAYSSSSIENLVYNLMFCLLLFNKDVSSFDKSIV